MQLQAVRTLTVRGQSQGLDKVKADLDQVSAAQQGVAQSATGMATATETSARRQLSAANAFERLMERNDRMIYLQRQLERELVVVNRAHEQGTIDATRQAQAVDLLQSKYHKLVAAERQARLATDAQTAATNRLAAANDNVRASTFNSANVAAQFQDIGVTAMMGQSPLTIALQQGTQLSAVLGQQGLTGVVRTLGSAFLSIINPVSLITIGVVGLAAAGIQAFTSMQNSAEESTNALEEHKEWLDKILAGYDAARDAANGARDAAVKLPAGAVISDLQADLKQQEEARQQLQRRIDDTKANLAYIAELYAGLGRTGGEGNVMGGIAAQIEGIRQLGVSAASSSDDLDAATVAASKLFNEADDPTVKDLANQVYTLAKELRTATGEINATTNAIVVMQQQAAKGFDISDTLSQIASLTPDLRTPKERVNDLFQQGAAAARTTGQLHNLADAASKAYAALDEQEAQREAEKAATATANATGRLAEAYRGVLDGAQRRIAQAQLEAETLGLSEAAASRLRAEYELLSQAEQAGVVVDAEKRKELTELADRMANAEERTRRLMQAREQQTAQMKQTTDALVSAAMALLRPWKSLDDVVSSVMGGFAQIGEGNIRSSLTNLINGTGSFAANDNGGWNDVWTKVGNSVRDGAKEGTSGGLADFLKNNGSNIGAGLGGLGIGYQTQNPLMGALGGAVSGLSAGPIGALIGGIGGLIGGFLGMNEELRKAKALLGENKQSISAFIGAGYGKEINETTAAVLRYKAQAAEYIKLAEAAGDRALVNRLREAAEAYRDTLRAQNRIAAAQDAVDASRDRLRVSYERESAALREVIDRSKAFVESIQAFKSSLLLDSNLSPLSPQDRLVQAQMQFQSTSTAAIGGDAAAQARLQDAASSYLEQARNFYASSGAYASIFDQVRSVLDRALAAGTTQASDAELQLSKMTEQVSKLIDINTSVVSVADAIKKLNADIAKLLAAQVAAADRTTAAVAKQSREASQASGRRAA